MAGACDSSCSCWRLLFFVPSSIPLPFLPFDSFKTCSHPCPHILLFLFHKRSAQEWLRRARCCHWVVLFLLRRELSQPCVLRLGRFWDLCPRSRSRHTSYGKGGPGEHVPPLDASSAKQALTALLPSSPAQALSGPAKDSLSFGWACHTGGTSFSMCSQVARKPYVIQESRVVGGQLDREARMALRHRVMLPFQEL